MEEQKSLDRLLFAILRKEDYDETVSQLTSHGFFVTRLSSSGGFLKKENVTMMLGVESGRMQEAVEILKTCAGRRRSQNYVLPTPGTGDVFATTAVPVEAEVGGVTLFTMKLEEFQKF